MKPNRDSRQSSSQLTLNWHSKPRVDEQRDDGVNLVSPARDACYNRENQNTQFRSGCTSLLVAASTNTEKEL